MPDRGEMDADLVRSPGAQNDGQQRSARARGDRLHFGDSSFAAVANAEGDRPDAREWCVDRLPFGEAAFRQRNVTFHDVFPLELPREVGVDVSALREKHHAARSAVEALHEKHVAGVFHHPIEQDRLLEIVAALHDDVGWLVDEDEEVVFVEDVEHVVAGLPGCRVAVLPATWQPGNSATNPDTRGTRPARAQTPATV